MKLKLFLTSCIIFLVALSSQAAPFPDLGHALYASGYTKSIWVNSFSPAAPYIARGDFNFDLVGDLRYGMSVEPTTGSVVPSPSGGSDASGTATNQNSFSSGGSLLIELDRNGLIQDSSLINFVGCPAHTSCPWTAHFGTMIPACTPAISGPPCPTWSVKAGYHVQGSTCGGELNIDMNATGCREALVARLNLPANYQFTQTDTQDTNYVSIPNSPTTALCSIIKPTCAVTPPVNPGPKCPNGVIDPGETCITCPADVGVCPLPPICLTGVCLPECGCTPPPPVEPPVLCSKPNQCALPAAPCAQCPVLVIPPDILAIINQAPSWTFIGTGRTVLLKKVRTWASNLPHPPVASTGLMELKLRPTDTRTRPAGK